MRYTTRFISLTKKRGIYIVQAQSRLVIYYRDALEQILEGLHAANVLSDGLHDPRGAEVLHDHVRDSGQQVEGRGDSRGGKEVHKYVDSLDRVRHGHGEGEDGLEDAVEVRGLRKDGVEL